MLYLCPSPAAFCWLHSKWWPAEVQADQKEQIEIMRRRFWRSFAAVLIVVGTTIVVMRMMGLLASLSSAYLLRASAATFALTGTLGRAGWAIQAWSGDTACEQIDRGMFVVSQMSATSLLLIALVM
jgi:hypothetical protein